MNNVLILKITAQNAMKMAYFHYLMKTRIYVNLSVLKALMKIIIKYAQVIYLTIKNVHQIVEVALNQLKNVLDAIRDNIYLIIHA